MKKRILIFPADTLCPMPHGYWIRTNDKRFVVKVWMMKPWEDELWQRAIVAIGGNDEQN